MSPAFSRYELVLGSCTWKSRRQTMDQMSNGHRRRPLIAHSIVADSFTVSGSVRIDELLRQM